MQYQIPPKQIQITQHSEEKTFFQIAEENTAENGPFHQDAAHAENFGGIFGFSNGTLSASATVTGYSIEYMPLIGPIPTEELKLQQIKNNLEQAVELKAVDK